MCPEHVMNPSSWTVMTSSSLTLALFAKGSLSFLHTHHNVEWSGELRPLKKQAVALRQSSWKLPLCRYSLLALDPIGKAGRVSRRGSFTCQLGSERRCRSAGRG